ncbi:extracellular calcium-sensing receptor-like [Polypterus senegalus]|uniref:extracellular calcium-sensing receptor-like n=1 Tax=Polypterus senegalus TaxID=55291 RepID=UPI00196517EC|nr:extracellular calcium-sensing receptor-like [Polypterus senegalus]
MHIRGTPFQIITVILNSATSCKILGNFNLPDIVIKGDIMIGGLFPVHDKVLDPDLSFSSKHDSSQCAGFNFRTFRWLQTMIFTIDEINRDNQLLPDIQLGYKIYDSCNTHFHALKAAVTLINGRNDTVSDLNCSPSIPVIIGDGGSTLSIAVARLLGVFKVPQISYFSSCACLSNKEEYPAFLRTIPSDFFQVSALAQLVKHFEWNWVGSIAGDDDYGRIGIQIFNEKLKQFGVCSAFTEIIPKNHALNKIVQIVQTIKSSNAKVILVFSLEQDAHALFQEVLQQNVTGIQWLASEAWITAALLSTSEYLKILGGSIGFAIRRTDIPGLREFLLKIHPSAANENPFIIPFWEQMFDCTFQDINNKTAKKKTPCSGFENLTSIHNIYSDVTQLRVSYNVHKSVYAIAQALHNMLSCENGKGPFVNNTCANMSSIKPWQLLYYLKNIHFTNKYGEIISFDNNGDPVPAYDLINWQEGTDGSVHYVTVGRFDGTVNLSPRLEIYEESIIWNGQQRQIPKSVCSENCLPGTRKGIRPGFPICCFDCILCADGEISNETDSVTCIKCSPYYWSNKKRDQCIPKDIEYLSFTDTMGISLLAISLLGSCFTIAIISVFAYYRNTPIVRANNSELSFLILFSLVLCFLCSVAFIGQPTVWSCMLRHTIFGIAFVLCISCILGKTIVVLIAFKATLPGKNIMKWFGAVQQRAIIFLCTMIQVVICTVWLVVSPPSPVKTMNYQSSKIILECHVGSLTAFILVLGYIGFLSSLCFVLAFLARKLPDNFNEAKFITFSMLIFFVVWTAFIPAYVSTPGKYTVATEIFAILSSSFGLLVCLFFPKCYIILIKPENNSKKHLLGKRASEKRF